MRLVGAFLALSFAACTVQVNREPVQTAAMEPAPPPPQPQPVTLTPMPVATGPGYRAVQGPGWAFAVPAHWQQFPMGPPVLVSVRDTTPVGGFLTNVNVVTEPFNGDGPSFALFNVPQLQNTATIIAQRPAVVSGLSSTELETVWSQANPPYRTVQRFVAQNGLGWVITCSGAHATFESVRGMCSAILDSFQLQ